MTTHYEALGIARTASHAEIRAAYRAAARRHHPDAATASGSQHADSSRMAAVNEAWRVLGDDRRRRDYDRTLDVSAGSVRADATARQHAASPPAAARRRNPLGTYIDTPRLPWRPMLAAVAIGTVAVLIAAARTPSTPLRPVDGRLLPGECTLVDAAGFAVETLCDGSQDGVVDTVVAEAMSCPQQTRPYPDRGGHGIACVRV